MTKNGHYVTGLVTGAVCVGAICRYGDPGWPWVTGAALGGWIGGAAPDRLEWIPGCSSRWITHRTLTHWLLLWLVGFGFFYRVLFQGPVMLVPAWQAPFWFGFFSGGLTHLLFDWPNPAGVPVWWPTRRHSLKLWKSGSLEWLLVPAWVVAAILFFVYTGSFDAWLASLRSSAVHGWHGFSFRAAVRFYQGLKIS